MAEETEELTVPQLLAALSEKENQARMAAEIGKALLEKNDEATRNLAEQKGTIEELTRQLNALTTRKEQEENDNTQLQAQVETLTSRLKVVQSQLLETEQLNSALATRVESLENDIGAARASENDARERHRRTSEQLQQTLQEWEETRVVADTAKREQSRADAERRRAEATAASLQQQLGKTLDQLSDINQKPDRNGVQKEKIAEIAAELEEAQEIIQEMKEEHHKLEEALTSATRENYALSRDREDLLMFLDEARNTVASLRQAENPANPASVVSKPIAGSSLLSELESELEKRITATKKSAATAEQKNCEEYFFLATTAVKIGMAMAYQHRSDDVFKISARELYQKVISKEIPFHEWHEWLREQLFERIRAEEDAIISASTSYSSRRRSKRK